MRDHLHYRFIATPLPDNSIVLEESEAHHARSVLRVRAGDVISATDGRGTVYSCVVETVGMTCVARIQSTDTVSPPAPRVHLYIGVPGRDGFEKALEGIVPFGVCSITPVHCQHCQQQWWKTKWNKHESRLNRILTSAAKQSLTAFLPELGDVVRFEQALDGAPGALVFGDTDGVRVPELAGILTGHDDVSAFVGPPGGFSSDELAALRSRNATGVWLSPLRLRTEIAAVAAAASLAQLMRA